MERQTIASQEYEGAHGMAQAILNVCRQIPNGAACDVFSTDVIVSAGTVVLSLVREKSSFQKEYYELEIL